MNELPVAVVLMLLLATAACGGDDVSATDADVPRGHVSSTPSGSDPSRDGGPTPGGPPDGSPSTPSSSAPGPTTSEPTSDPSTPDPSSTAPSTEDPGGGDNVDLGDNFGGGEPFEFGHVVLHGSKSATWHVVNGTDGTATAPAGFPITITMTVSGTAFSATVDTCQGQTFPVGSGCDVEVTFHPEGNGRQDGALTIVAGGDVPGFSLALTGTGGFGPSTNPAPSSQTAATAGNSRSPTPAPTPVTSPATPPAT